MRALSDLPLVPGSEPIFGHVRALRRDRLGILLPIADHVDRTARFATFPRDGLVVNHPVVLQELLVEKARAFEKSFITRFTLGPIGGEGLFTSRHDVWKPQRRVMAPIFQPAQLARYADDMVACTDRVLATLRDGEVRELFPETTRITMSVAGKTLFDADTLSEADAIGQALNVALDWAAANSPGPFSVAHLLGRAALDAAATRLERTGARGAARRAAAWGARLESPLFFYGRTGRELAAAIRLLDDQVEKMIEARRRLLASGQEPPADLLSRLLTAQDQDGARMTNKQLRDEILTLFVAGHETTGTSLAWTLRLLCENPAIHEAVVREVDALPGDPTPADLPKLDLTLRAFKEALRLYPPAYILGRQSVTDTAIDDVALPTGSLVLVAVAALHRRPDLWPAPERFDPDRYTAAEEAKRHRLAWLPFGAGPRVCIGNHFALMEGQIVLAKLLRHASFEAVGAEAPLAGLTLRPRNGALMRIRLRRRTAS